MSSSVLKNSPGLYCLEQRGHKVKQDLMFDKSYKIPTFSKFPTLGFNPSNMRTGIYHNILSNNPIDIESELRGIQQANLVKPKSRVYPSINKLGEQSYFDRPCLLMPNPVVVEKNQRAIGPYESYH